MKDWLRRICCGGLLFGWALGLGACGRSKGDLPEWTPADHDNQKTPSAGQVDTKVPRAGMPDLAKQGIDDVILASWKQNCVPCHGVIGRGDGPSGAATNPRDLTDPNWQRVAIDSEIAFAISKGRGRMPGFPHLPEETVSGLVKLVRLLNADRPSPPAAAAPHP